MKKGKQHGFTLIELMITVAIIGILAAVAYPSYTQYIVRANRSSVQSFMFSVANKQEQYMLDARFYAGGSTALADLHMTLPSDIANKYTVTVICTMPTATGNCTEVAGVPAYLITGTPSGSQATNDTRCAVLTLNHLGGKTKSGTASAISDCW